jgi:integrase
MGKRANGEGTVYYDKTRSRWRAEITDGSGRKRKITAKTKKDAAAKLSVFKSEIADGRLVAQRMTVNQLAETWVKKVHDAKALAPATRSNNKWAIGVIQTHIGSIQISKLSPDRIEVFFEDLVRKGHGFQSITKVRNMLSQMMAFAERRNYVLKNPVPLTLIPSEAAKTSEKRTLTTKQAKLLVEETQLHVNGLIFTTMLYLGLRPSEACALTWSSIDFVNQTISVTRSIRSENGVKYLSEELKTRKSRRSLSASPGLLMQLEAHRHMQDEQRALYGDLWPAEFADVVFVSAAGTLIDSSNLRRMLKKVTHNIGLGDWSPNELRHTNITLMYEGGISAEQVADHAGHTTTRMVETVYRHSSTYANDAARRGLLKLGFE